MGRYNNTNTSARRHARYTCAITLIYLLRHVLQGMSWHPTADQWLQCAEQSSTGQRSTQPNVQQGGKGKSQCQKSSKNKLSGRPCGVALKDMFTHTLRPSPWPARNYTRRGRRHWSKVMFYKEKRRACLCTRVWCERYLCLNYKRICSHTR